MPQKLLYYVILYTRNMIDVKKHSSIEMFDVRYFYELEYYKRCYLTYLIIDFVDQYKINLIEMITNKPNNIITSIT